MVGEVRIATETADGVKPGCASVRAVIFAVVFGIGVVVGLLVGRWWALLAALGVFLWIGTSTEVESPSPWALALVYAGITSAGIAAGVLGRGALGRAGTRGNTRSG